MRRPLFSPAEPPLLWVALLVLSALTFGACLDDDALPPGAEGGTDTGMSPDAGVEEEDLGPEDMGPPDLAVEEDLGGQEEDAGAEPDAGGALCTEGETRCWDEKLARCLEGGVGWLVEACPEGTLCVEGECLEHDCLPGQERCQGDSVQRCVSELMVWSEPEPCDEGETCLRGVCIPRSCEPGTRLCGRDRLLTCGEDGLSWEEEDCAEGWVCFDGRCIECVRDTDCGEDGVCSDGSCTARPLEILTERLPAGTVGGPYEVTLVAAGGVAPYTWSLVEGELPAGLELSGEGVLRGVPEETGELQLTLRTEDTEGSQAEVTLTLRIHGDGLTLATEDLPVAEEGSGYAATLEAVGGTPPYAWMIADGVLPAGLDLLAGGTIAGVPSEIGDFPLTVKVFDNSTPPQMAETDLTLTVEIAPLEIYGEQEFDLFLFKVITLPMITVIENVPIPYSTQLTARGGLRPYHWVGEETPDELRFLLPRAGIPEGLELAEDGTLSGAVTSTEMVSTLTIPFTEIELSGFFFAATVEDSQEAPARKTALFLLPTLPIGGGAN